MGHPARSTAATQQPRTGSAARDSFPAGRRGQATALRIPKNANVMNAIVLPGRANRERKMVKRTPAQRPTAGIAASRYAPCFLNKSSVGPAPHQINSATAKKMAQIASISIRSSGQLTLSSQHPEDTYWPKSRMCLAITIGFYTEIRVISEPRPSDCGTIWKGTILPHGITSRISIKTPCCGDACD